MKDIRGAIASLAVAGTLVGCGGGAATAPSNALLPASQMRPERAPVIDQRCPSEKGVSAKPCVVKLSAGTPEVTVTTAGPKGGKFTFHDSKCTSRLIATIKGKRGSYKVKAGTHGRGQCVATFVDYSAAGKRLGAAKVIILNNVDEGS
ncbi:MAG TPA: hypothetical protein VGG51_08710 [Candidatus Cybelea sp.]